MRNKLYCEAKRAFLSNFFSNSKHALLDILLVPWGRILSGMRKKGGIAFKIASSEQGVYIPASRKNSSPPPLKFFPVFVDFFALL